MSTLELITAFIGWCTVLNIAVILIVFVIWSQTHAYFSPMFAKMFGVTDTEVKDTVFRIFMQYRLLLAAFNLIPYVALKIIG